MPSRISASASCAATWTTFITKPIEQRQLQAAVERSIDDRPIVLGADDCATDAVSHNIDPEARKHSVRHGCVGYIEKSIMQNELVGLLQTLIVHDTRFPYRRAE